MDFGIDAPIVEDLALYDSSKVFSQCSKLVLIVEEKGKFMIKIVLNVMDLAS